MPVKNTSVPTNFTDLFNIWNVPVRDRLRFVLAGIGGGVAGRGKDLNAILERANPTLRQLRRVTSILDDQRRQLGTAVETTDAVVAELAGDRRGVQDLVEQARAVDAPHRAPPGRAARDGPPPARVARRHAARAEPPRRSGPQRHPGAPRPSRGRARIERVVGDLQPFSRAAAPPSTGSATCRWPAGARPAARAARSAPRGASRWPERSRARCSTTCWSICAIGAALRACSTSPTSSRPLRRATTTSPTSCRRTSSTPGACSSRRLRSPAATPTSGRRPRPRGPGSPSARSAGPRASPRPRRPGARTHRLRRPRSPRAAERDPLGVDGVLDKALPLLPDLPLPDLKLPLRPSQPRSDGTDRSLLDFLLG